MSSINNFKIKFKDNKIKMSIIGTIIILIIIMSSFGYDYLIRKEILRNYSTAKAEIKNVSLVGEASTTFITYVFEIDGIKYDRKIDVTTTKFDICHNDITLCKGIEYWVVYLKTDPIKSLIYLKKNVVELDFKFPDNTDDFE